MTDIIHAPHSLDDLTDQQLVSLTRAGNLDAYGVLFFRFNPAAVRLARSFRAGVDADDVAAAAFEGVLSAIRGGNGPRDSFVAYLLTAVRNELGRRARGREFPAVIYDVPVFDHHDDQHEASERVRVAFASLLPRHQRMLWDMEVEGLRPRELAGPGLSANGVSAAGLRARVALRLAFESVPS